MILKEVVRCSQHLLHVLSHLEEDDIRRFNEPGVSIDRVYASLSALGFVQLSEENSIRLPLGDHKLQWLSVVCLTQVVEVWALEVTQAVVYVAQDTRYGTCTHGVPALVLLRYPEQVLILTWRVVG